MPRIDPLQLLKCLSVLLTPEGGILSREEVPRLVDLMTKFSKKLVSKCVYVLILKSTDTDLVDMFMAEGGWTLIQTWLQDAVQTANWDLVKEILGLLLITPVDVERLKLNILPKLIKSLSRREELEGVAKLSTQLVQHWLAIVKGSSAAAVQQQVRAIQPSQTKPEESEQPQTAEQATENKENLEAPSENENSNAIGTAANGGPEEEAAKEASEESNKEEESKKEEEKKGEDKERSRSHSHTAKSGSKSSRDKDRDRDKKKSSSSSSKNSSSSKSSSSSRDKDRKDRDKDRDRHRSGSSTKSDSKSSSKSSKERRDSKEKDKDKRPEKNREKQAERDKDTLAKIRPQSVDKLGRIPKKLGTPEEKAREAEAKRKTFSVGIRKDSEERPKTVKVFNSKMRSTGLEEEVRPAPPRSVKKPTPSVQLPTIPAKRPSPPRERRDPLLPPEKKLKMDRLDAPERPGAIKLIPPKPKPAVLQESDLFMDALTASATAKKEPKKRKRRASITKDSTASPSASPAREQQPQTPTSPSQTVPGSPSLGLKNIAPINFYQDTLKTDETTENSENADNENKENAVKNDGEDRDENGDGSKDTPRSPMTPTDDTNCEEVCESKKPKLEGGLKGVLLYTKKKGPKRSISWKNETDLVEIRYFELDETERVNVTKTFGDMAKMEMTSEREALQMSRKLVNEDTMEAQIPWRHPYLIDLPEPPVVPGQKSLEKDIQFAREKSVLQALYFDRRRIPDSPEEPIPEIHQISDPIIIPLEDPETQEIDLRSTPWPEPKGLAPHVEPQIPPHMFPNMPAPFNHPFNSLPPPQFQGMPPRFPAQGPPPVGNPGPMGQAPFMPPSMLPNGNIMGPPNMGPPNEMLNSGPMNQNMFSPGPVHDGFGPGPDFPMFNQNMPNNMNMFPPNNFNNHRQGNRGGFRRGGGGNSGNWVRMSGSGNWKRGGGGGHRGGRLCKNVQNHGYCRNRDKCPFIHP